MNPAEEHESFAVILIAHGSRKPNANEELVQVARSLQQKILQSVYPAFLEIAEPSILTAGRDAVADGANHLVLLPYFLSAGRHAIDDLRSACKQLEEETAGLKVDLAEPLGPHPLLETILCERLEQAVAGRSSRTLSADEGSMSERSPASQM